MCARHIGIILQSSHPREILKSLPGFGNCLHLTRGGAHGHRLPRAKSYKAYQLWESPIKNRYPEPKNYLHRSFSCPRDGLLNSPIENRFLLKKNSADSMLQLTAHESLNLNPYSIDMDPNSRIHAHYQRPDRGIFQEHPLAHGGER